jgi:hypothetical protein
VALKAARPKAACQQQLLAVISAVTIISTAEQESCGRAQMMLELSMQLRQPVLPLKTTNRACSRLPLAC